MFTSAALWINAKMSATVKCIGHTCWDIFINFLYTFVENSGSLSILETLYHASHKGRFVTILGNHHHVFLACSWRPNVQFTFSKERLIAKGTLEFHVSFLFLLYPDPCYIIRKFQIPTKGLHLFLWIGLVIFIALGHNLSAVQNQYDIPRWTNSA